MLTPRNVPALPSRITLAPAALNILRLRLVGLIRLGSFRLVGRIIGKRVR
jgi:hypothetical protein